MKKNLEVIEKKEMKDYEVKNLNNLKKYMKNVLNIENFDKMPIRTIVKHIKEADKGESWKDNKLYALKSYFETLNRRTKMLSTIAIKNTRAMKKKEKNQEQSEKEKENYLTYDELNVLLEKYKKYDTLEEMNNYLILASICTDQPVLRPGVLATSKIIFSKSNLNDTDNFLVLDKKNKKGYFYINNDKVSDSEKFKTNKKINLHPNYAKIIFDSINKYQREYLFDIDVKNKEIKLLLLLQKITESEFTFCMARSSFINNWYKTNLNANQNDIDKLCSEMRHSASVHRNNYKKVKEITGNLMKHSLMKEKKKVYDLQLENKPDDEILLPKKVISEKYEKNAAYDLVYKANKRKENDNDCKIKEDTMTKYNIIIGDDGKYKITKKPKKQIIKNTKQLQDTDDMAKFKKRRSDVIRNANNRIKDGKDTNIKPDTMLHYHIKYNKLKKIYE